MVIEPSTLDNSHTIKCGNIIGSKEPPETLASGLKNGGIRENIATDTAESVDSEDIESVINIYHGFDLATIVAADSANNTENNSRPRRNVTGSRCNERLDQKWHQSTIQQYSICLRGGNQSKPM